MQGLHHVAQKLTKPGPSPLICEVLKVSPERVLMSTKGILSVCADRAVENNAKAITERMFFMIMFFDFF
jgi:hypothetical protein